MALYIEDCIEQYKKIIISAANTTTPNKGSVNYNLEDFISQKETEERFATAFFIYMNNAIFSGEYLQTDYDAKLIEFENTISQIDSPFSIQLKDALAHLRYLINLVDNKVNLSEEDLLFAAIKTRSQSEGDNDFLDDFSNVSISLAISDHMLISSTKDDIANLIFILDRIELRKNIANDDLKEIYAKLYNKCLFLLKKLSFVLESSHKYALDFQVYDIDEMLLSNIHNNDFNDLFECLYNKRNIASKSHVYQAEFREKKFSTKGFVVLAQYYRTYTKNISQIENLIWRYNKFYTIQKRDGDICQFNRYAIECVRHYLYNCQFSLKLDNPQYTISELANDIKQIRKVQTQTQILNYHPYYKGLEFLCKKIKDNAISRYSSTQIDEFSELFCTLLDQYENALDWCVHRCFYPFQLTIQDCINSENVFFASSFSVPLNVKRLNSLSLKYRDNLQMLRMHSQYLTHKKELDDIQTKISSFRKETFEYIGIFIAIITFLFGSLQMFTTKLDWNHAIINVISLGAILCLFSINLSIVFREWAVKYKFFYFGAFFVIAVFILIFAPQIFTNFQHNECKQP